LTLPVPPAANPRQLAFPDVRFPTAKWRHFPRMGTLVSVTLPRTLLFLSAICLCLAGSLLAGCGDRQESFYPNLSDADKAGAITRGWIPDNILPASSRTIHVVGELSPSREWCSFEFLPTDSQTLSRNLKSVDGPPPPVRHIPSPHMSWWPSVLEGNLDVAEIRKAGFQLYIVEEPKTSVTTEIFLFAIDWPRGRGFFYSKSKQG
jgi:hypothetical protein